jgi:hypothetical protein
MTPHRKANHNSHFLVSPALGRVAADTHRLSDNHVSETGQNASVALTRFGPKMGQYFCGENVAHGAHEHWPRNCEALVLVESIHFCGGVASWRVIQGGVLSSPVPVAEQLDAKTGPKMGQKKLHSAPSRVSRSLAGPSTSSSNAPVAHVPPQNAGCPEAARRPAPPSARWSPTSWCGSNRSQHYAAALPSLSIGVHRPDRRPDQHRDTDPHHPALHHPAVILAQGSSLCLSSNRRFARRTALTTNNRKASAATAAIAARPSRIQKDIGSGSSLLRGGVASCPNQASAERGRRVSNGEHLFPTVHQKIGMPSRSPRAHCGRARLRPSLRFVLVSRSAPQSSGSQAIVIRPSTRSWSCSTSYVRASGLDTRLPPPADDRAYTRLVKAEVQLVLRSSQAGGETIGAQCLLHPMSLSITPARVSLDQDVLRPPPMSCHGWAFPARPAVTDS